MAHDLRQPLSVVMGVAVLLEESWDELPEERKKQHIALISRSATWMDSLINDLLVPTGDDKSVSSEAVSFPVLEMAEATIGDLAPHVRGRVALYAKDDLPNGFGDPVKQRRVLQNLLENAIKYSPLASPIDVSITEQAQTLAITVADRGLGIQLEDMPTIFDKYVRVADDPVTISGNGLGLYVCKAMVNAAGGEIGVESNSGSVGSIFTFTLPMAD